MSTHRPHLVLGMPRPGIALRSVKGVVLTLCCLVVLVPFLGVLATSIAPPKQVAAAGGFVLFPKGIDLSSYRAIFAGGVVTRSIVVSVLVTVVGTLVSVTCTALLAYVLARPKVFGYRPLMTTVLVAILFGPGIIPSYLVVKQLGLLDSYWALILPTAVSAFNVIVVRSFFMGIPPELIEAATIDGAGEFQVFRRIVIPLSKASLSVIGLFYAVGYWNAFFTALLYINDNAKWPLQLILRTYVVDQSALTGSALGSVTEAIPPQQSIQMAILVVSIVPILIVYPFLQRHFAKGVLTGAVKG
ncbi:ABC transporter permease [Frondihabitans sucicola]|uniref:ABC transporter permease n=1 Tax=Frondihabitans sucicola TaxID=1268041 RepID=A0ABM8GHR9_9MICO|nr:carbohydrate ABC transporter permease [Frondihabitans sucicola]BDZ47916.1 ABC transporter permease [Frondihabitans sucicola]